MSRSGQASEQADWAGQWLPPCLPAGELRPGAQRRPAAGRAGPGAGASRPGGSQPSGPGRSGLPPSGAPQSDAPQSGFSQPSSHPPGSPRPGSLRPGSAEPGTTGLVFSGAADAVAAVEAGLAFLAAGAAGLPSETLAGCLRGLGRAEALLTAARSRLLSAFSAGGGPQGDGQPTARSWLRWQTRSTGAAAGVQVWWMRRLAVHPQIGAALAAAAVSLSWARLICEWSERLPPDVREDADTILLQAAADGADLSELSRIAGQLHAATAPPDPEPGSGPPGDDDAAFTGRRVWLDLHWKGAGRLTGDLTPECAAALGAALDSLGKRAGPEDDRSQGQRHHDALEELCRIALGTGNLPDVAGQPARVLLHVTLDQLAARPGAPEAAAAWAASGAGPGWLRSAAAAQGYACDAKIQPVVTGHIDPAVLAALTAQVREMTTRRRTQPGTAQPPAPPAGTGQPPAPPTDPTHSGQNPTDRTRADQTQAGQAQAGKTPPAGASPGPEGGPTADRSADRPPGTPNSPETRPPGNAPPANGLPMAGAAPGHPPAPGELRGPQPGPGPERPPQPAQQPGDALTAGTLLRWAVDLLSGPAGLAAALRTAATGPPEDRFPARSISLPLDVGAATATIPPHLRRAVTVRDRHCAFPGCHRPPSHCQTHHVIPRSQGGVTALHNLVLLCSYHHLNAIHRHGWVLALHPDGTTTATSPDRTRTYHSNPPPPTRSARAA